MYICNMERIDSFDVYALSNATIAKDLGERFRLYRTALGLTQKEISRQTGISVMTILRFEKGAGNSIRLDNLIALMRSIQRLDEIDALIPEIPPSLYSKKARR